MEIIIENLNKYYGKNHVLKDVSLTLTPGVYGLLGPNGAGKTTLIHVLIGLLEYESGTIQVKNQIMFNSDEYISKIGYLPQYPSFYPEFKIQEFLEYMCVLKGVDPSEIQSKIDKLLVSVNLSNKRSHKIKTLSGGMKQRLGIAQALINDPELLILDEPTSGLDPKERIRFRNIISKLSKDKIIIFSSHIISDIEHIADTIFLLKDGKLIVEESQSLLLKSIFGIVQEMSISKEELVPLSEIYKITRVKQLDNGYLIRFMSHERVGDVVNPDIEDVYMYYFGDEYEQLDTL